MNGESVVKRAKHWWRRAEIWIIGGLLVLSGMTLGYQLAMYDAHRLMTIELTNIRAAYDHAMGRKDERLESLVETTSAAAKTAASAAETASQAASKAADVAAQPPISSEP
jgi:predicted negative regulator of RcsB-dependent stress response